jgi:hypothetical protein
MEFLNISIKSWAALFFIMTLIFLGLVGIAIDFNDVGLEVFSWFGSALFFIGVIYFLLREDD